MSLRLAGRLLVLLTFQIIYQAQRQHEEQNMKTQPCIIGKNVQIYSLQSQIFI